MANIITKDIFKKGELKLPIDNYAPSEIDFFITDHEKIILKKLLGYVLYKAFIDGLAVLPAENIEQKWLDLRDGDKEYEHNGVTNEYLGIKQMIADYVFVQIVSDKLTYITSSGAKKGESENSLPANPKAKQKFALNDINDRQKTLDGFILSSNETDSTTYEDYLPTLQTRVTVFGF